jgi:AcrR family transcriptional regulator
MATPTTIEKKANEAPPRSSRRQWQRDETIGAIERAALPVLLRQGYAATTAEHLADAAGVSIRTLFRYFPSGKDDVIVAEVRRSLDALEATLRSRPSSERLLDALDASRLEWIAENSQFDMGDASRLTTDISRHQPSLTARLMGERQMFAERVVDEFALRLKLDPNTDLRPRLFAHCYVAALVTGYFTSLELHDADPRALVDQALDLIRPLLDSTN